ncbi:8-oxo-dGTP diphosphatase [Microcella alkalica]|uniref:8-oxo-dGTP diphosphatase n=1 Tax=Microcella alkalica TaxID=355930 RepID=UPI001CB73BCF|nr:NUDIX domain-containing protein [Microcella alkalica]
MFDVSVVYLTREVESADGPRTEVLLGRKRTGLGVGRLVAPGGKLEPGETPADAAVREVREEVGLEVRPRDLVPIAEIAYPFLDRPQLSQFSWAFTASVFTGAVGASAELEPAWFPLASIPFDRMWADARRWVPRALGGEYVAATLTFGEGDALLHEDWSGARRS